MQNRWLYPFDADADAIQRWKETAALVEAELVKGEITPLFNVSSGVAV
jgi:hypothetical protein